MPYFNIVWQIVVRRRPVPPVDVLNAIAGGEDSSPSSSASGNKSSESSSSSARKKLHRERKVDVPDAEDDFSSIQHFPEEVQTDLIAVAEWLNLNDRDEFMNVYASVRGQVMKKSLDLLKDYRRSASGGSGGGGGQGKSPAMNRKFSSPIVVGGGEAGGAAGGGTPSGKKSQRISNSINR